MNNVILSLKKNMATTVLLKDANLKLFFVVFAFIILMEGEYRKLLTKENKNGGNRMLKGLKTKNCKICGKVFFVRLKFRRSGRKSSKARPIQSITCSKRCSKAHYRGR